MSRNRGAVERLTVEDFMEASEECAAMVREHFFGKSG
jgi:hypothetical protein